MEARERSFGVFGEAVLDVNAMVAVAHGVAYMEGGIMVPIGADGEQEAKEWVRGLYGEDADGGDKGEESESESESGSGSGSKITRKRVSDAEVAQWVAWRDAGWTGSQIALEAGRPLATVKSWLAKHDKEEMDGIRDTIAGGGEGGEP